MASLFERNLARIDFPVDPDDGQAGYGSTDAGNVSHAVPTIHPYIRTAPDGVPGHSREFAEHNATPLARAGMVAGAKALALTALDLLAEPAALAGGEGRIPPVRAEWRRREPAPEPHGATRRDALRQEQARTLATPGCATASWRGRSSSGWTSSTGAAGPSPSSRSSS